MTRNPLAFPVSFDGENSVGNEGMFLRDYFAAAAMQGLVAKYTLKTPEDQITITKLAYELSDTMLNERQKETE